MSCDEGRLQLLHFSRKNLWQVIQLRFELPEAAERIGKPMVPAYPVIFSKSRIVSPLRNGYGAFASVQFDRRVRFDAMNGESAGSQPKPPEFRSHD
ncbi:hypothetical protein WJ09_18410 [Burkholderia vietnamiensis]|nr:hypothetical protein WJ09_18410 [Burkholderia vietnamiensis]